MMKTRGNQDPDQVHEGDEAQGSQQSHNTDDLDSIITTRLAELLQKEGVMTVAARYDGRAGIASRRCLEVAEKHFTRLHHATSQVTLSGVQTIVMQ